VGWSLLVVRGDHGPVQIMLAPVLSPASVFPLAAVNALMEEVEFRMLLLGSLLAGAATGSPVWVSLAMVLHATYFAVLHYLGGFPSGRFGFVLVFVWGLFLGFLRWWTGGMVLVLLCHMQADIVVFLLVMLEERRRTEQEKQPKAL
ncbi:unnamed protein product, partial [Polarella glacialis]